MKDVPADVLDQMFQPVARLLGIKNLAVEKEIVLILIGPGFDEPLLPPGNSGVGGGAFFEPAVHLLK